MTYYAALDVSLRSVNICVIDDQGEIKAEAKLDSEVTDIIAYLDKLELKVSSVGLEAGTLCQYLTYGLQSAGYEVVCMEARQVKAALSAMRNKTDKNDARGIAQLLRCGWYSRVHIKSMASHRVRALRSSLCSHRSDGVEYHAFRCYMQNILSSAVVKDYQIPAVEQGLADYISVRGRRRIILRGGNRGVVATSVR